MNNILIAVAIALSLISTVNLPGSVLAAATAIVSVSAPTQAVSSGTQFTVNITVQPNNAIAGAQFSLSFNPALISINSVSEGNLLNQGGASTYFMTGTINNTAGTITGIARAITTPGVTVSATGTFAVITMTAGPSKGTSALTISNVIVGDINGQSVNQNVVNGQVVMISGTNTTTPPPTEGAGGGGSGLIGPTSAAGVITVNNSVNAQGVFNQDLNAYSDDNNVLLYIPSGTAGLNSKGAPFTQINIIHMTTTPAFETGAGMGTFAYDLQPSGATFNPPITVRFSYDPTLIPPSMAETSLQIAYNDNTTSTWITLPSTVDTTNHSISAHITHFTPYAVTYGIKPVTQVPTITTTTAVTTPTPTTTMKVLTQAMTTTSTMPTTTTVVTTAMELPTTPNTKPPNNMRVFRLSFLAAAIGAIVFLIVLILPSIFLLSAVIVQLLALY